MVMRYVTLLLFMSGLFLITTPVFSQSENNLNIFISKTDKQWGQFLRVTLEYSGAERLDEIDLQSWLSLVEIKFEDEYGDEDEAGMPIQVLQLRLYPRKIGKYILASLKMGKAQSRPVEINISEIEVKGAAIKLDWQISTASPWQREAVVVRVQLQTTDYAARIKLDAPTAKSFIARALNVERHVRKDGSYRFDAGWIFYPIESGSLMLDLPSVRYQIAGSDRRRFYFPRQKLQVKPLPTYLPPTLPIGKLDVSSFIDDKEQWQLHIKTDALIPNGMPELESQFTEISDDEVVINYSHRSEHSDYGDTSVYSAFMPTWLLPLGQDLKLNLRFFDTETGRLGTLLHTLPRSWNMPVWAWAVFTVLSLIVAMIVLNYFQPRIQAKLNQRTLRRQLHLAADAEQLRRVILDNEKMLALSEWVTKKSARKQVVDQLNYYCFSPFGEQDIQQLKVRLLQLA